MIGLLDIGGTKLAAAVAVDGRIGPVLRTATPAAPADVLEELLARASGGAPLEAIGISTAGPLDRGTRALLAPPGMPPAWHGLELGERLGARFGCPVHIENDANCAALAEARAGAGRGLRGVVYLTISTGIGTGVVRDGRIVPTRTDTEGGHQVLWPEWLGGPPCHCGGHGCMEALAGGLAIERRFGTRAEHLADAGAWEDIGRWLGLGVVNVTVLHDPDAVVFGGGVTASWSRFAPALMRTVESHLLLLPRPLITLGTLGEERSLTGALEVVRDAGPGR